jgi:large subunit ribosomal protein L13
MMNLEGSSFLIELDKTSSLSYPIFSINRNGTSSAMKTYSAKPNEVTRRWFVVDAEGQVLGRMATRIAEVLRGKNKAAFTPHVDTGDFVVVVNAEKVKLTGRKLEQKQYWRHSGYQSGLKQIPAKDMLARKPEAVIREAVWGMLPKNRLNRQIIRKLKVYAGPDHPHQAQQPQPLEIKAR